MQVGLHVFRKLPGVWKHLYAQEILLPILTGPPINKLISIARNGTVLNFLANMEPSHLFHQGNEILTKGLSLCSGPIKLLAICPNVFLEHINDTVRNLAVQCVALCLTMCKSETSFRPFHPTAFAQLNLPYISVDFFTENLKPILLIAFLGIAIIVYTLYRLWKKLCLEKDQGLRKQMVMEFQISLAEKYVEKEKEKQQELTHQLDFKDKQLTSYALSYEQKNRIIDQLQEIVKKIEDTTSPIEKDKLVKNLKEVTKDNLIADKNWDYFREFFQETQHGFHSKLLSKHPDLKPNDLKLCSVIRLNLSIKEAAQVLGISPGSLKTSRYRLRKKLELDSKQEIIDYLILLEDEEDASGTDFL